MSEVLNPFVYELPKERIAERPLHPYDAAKMLVLNNNSGELKTSSFSELDQFLSSNDVLFFNNTKVIKSRLFGKISGREKEAEVFIIKKESTHTYKCIAKPIKNLKSGTFIHFNENLKAEVLERVAEQHLLLKFDALDGKVESSIEATAVMPIPPYIRKGRADEQDIADYQSLFAENAGSIAAPTASLHFTEGLLNKLKEKGVRFESLTLHLGQGSFRTLWDGEDTKNVRPPEGEYFKYDSSLIKRIEEYKKSGKRIIAVGTSVVRALETMLASPQYNDSDFVETDLFIFPGYKFKAVDALVTNFHFPASSHLLLVQALIGEDNLKSSYNYALANGYRFLSYGDGMLII